jgi:hypothetical protein
MLFPKSSVAIILASQDFLRTDCVHPYESSRTDSAPTSRKSYVLAVIATLSHFLDNPLASFLLGFLSFSLLSVLPTWTEKCTDNNLWKFLAKSPFQLCISKVSFHFQKQTEKASPKLPQITWKHKHKKDVFWGWR